MGRGWTDDELIEEARMEALHAAALRLARGATKIGHEHAALCDFIQAGGMADCSCGLEDFFAALAAFRELDAQS